MLQLEADLAAAFELDPLLIPHISYLLQDFDDLSGGSVPLVLDLLRPLGIGPQSSVLDLGCGKGHLACLVAREFGCRVTGVDLVETFVSDAREAAVRQGVGHLCRFSCGDVRQALTQERGCDFALWIAVGRILGSLSAVVAGMRATVLSGGYLVIDDAFLADGASPPSPDYSCYGDHRRTLSELLSRGDRLVAERVVAMDEQAAWNRDAITKIERRAAELATRHPDLADSLAAYVQRQYQENEWMADSVRGAVWVLQKA